MTVADEQTRVGEPHVVSDDGVRWLAEVFGELFRLGIALLSRRYPSIRRKDACPRCGHRG